MKYEKEIKNYEVAKNQMDMLTAIPVEKMTKAQERREDYVYENIFIPAYENMVKVLASETKLEKKQCRTMLNAEHEKVINLLKKIA